MNLMSAVWADLIDQIRDRGSMSRQAYCGPGRFSPRRENLASNRAEDAAYSALDELE